MPGPWSPEHRAAYEETMRLRREARAAGTMPTQRRKRLRSDHVHGPRHAGRGCATCDATRPGYTIETAPHLVAEMVHAEAKVAEVLATPEHELRAMADRIRDLAAAVERPGPEYAVLEEVRDLRSTMLRLENRIIVTMGASTTAQGADPRLVAAMRTINGRLTALEGAVADRRAWEQEVLTLLRRIDSRPPRVIEFRPDHRREKDGGTPIRTQRAAAGLRKRPTRGTERAAS